ncbi:MAG TPA: GNAT family N-acetyltransferase [Herpetosiphonaceae bacterium]|nr:GNAT family N-acetyltransferase [Herpetosiphonaceae bacterium]
MSDDRAMLKQPAVMMTRLQSGALDVRVLTTEDGGLLQQTWLQGLRQYSDVLDPAFEAQIQLPLATFVARFLEDSSPESFFLGAFLADQFVGMLMFRRSQGDRFRHIGNIGALYVIPEARRRGIGKALLAEATRLVGMLPGLAYVKLSVVARPMPAAAWYRSLGFESIYPEQTGGVGQKQPFDVYWLKPH